MKKRDKRITPLMVCKALHLRKRTVLGWCRDSVTPLRWTRNEAGRRVCSRQRLLEFIMSKPWLKSRWRRCIRQRKGYKDRFGVAQAAVILGVSKMTVLRWIKRLGLSPSPTGATPTAKVVVGRTEIAELARQYDVEPRWPKDKEIFLGAKAAAEALGISRKTFCRLVEEVHVGGRSIQLISGKDVNGRMYFTKEYLIEFSHLHPELVPFSQFLSEDL